MSDVDRQHRELDDELVRSAALVHRKDYAVVRAAGPVSALMALLDTPNGRAETAPTPSVAKKPVRY